MGLCVAAGTAILGRDLWLREGARAFGDILYYAVVATAGVPTLEAQWALYERPDRLALLPLPLPPRAHFADAVRVLVARVCPLGLAVAGLAVGPLLGGAPAARALVTCGTTVGAFAIAVTSGLGLAALAGRAAMRSDDVRWQQVRASLAGGWAAPEHAPFFWSPGLSVALAAVSTAAVARGAVPAGAAVALALGLALAGRRAYGRALFQVAPLTAEHARSLLGGRELSPPSPVGLALGRLLPRAARPFFARDATQLSRLARGRGVLAALGLAALEIAALRTSAAPWVVVGAIGLLALLAGAALRLARPDATPRWLESVLPATAFARVTGRAGAVAPLPAAIGACAAIGLALAGASAAPAVLVAVAAGPLAIAAASAALLRRDWAPWTYAALATALALGAGAVA